MAGPSLKQRWDAVKSAMRFGAHPALSYGGAYGGYWGRAGSGAVDYVQAAGDPIDNSIVFAAIDWIARTMPEAPMRVVRETPKGDEPLPAHPFALKWRRPNPFDSGSLLWAPIILSYILDANAYLLKERTNGGDVLNLWYEPHWNMEPRGTDTAFIAYYDRRIDGRTERWAVEDVIHLRKGKDPKNPRKGLAPLKAILREIGTDNLALQYSMAMLANYGTPSMIVSPGNPDQVFTTEQAAFIKQQIVEKTTGSERGKPMISLAASKVDIPSFSPQQMNVRESQWTPEERISAVLGIPAIVVGLGAGLQHGTFANTKQMKEKAYDDYLIPTQGTIAEQLTIQLLPDFSTDPAERVAFDYADVRALQEDATAVADRAAKIFVSGIFDRASAMLMIGEEPKPGDHDVYLLPRGASFSDGTIAEPVAPQTMPVDTEPGAKPATNGKKPTDAAALAALAKNGA
jgi:HK97 family phage portal protein